MKVKIERTLNEAYLIIEENDTLIRDTIRDGNIDAENDFEVKMLTENEIKGILPLRIRPSENGQQFVYGIRGSSPLSDKFEKQSMHSDELKAVIGGLQEGLSLLEEYMIRTDHVLLDPRYLFMDNTSLLLKLCVYPYYDGCLRDSLSKLADFIISKTDHGEDLAIDLAYGFYRQIMAGDYRFDELLEIGNEKENIENSKIENAPNRIQNRNQNGSSRETLGSGNELSAAYEIRKSNNNDNSVGKSILVLLIFAAVVFCLALCFLLLYFEC